ncbi:MAG: 6-carboxytetrahydropterin synthase QueD [Acidobacteria bacterium]|nr:MAG: 6-carboxytetrahydropterin synthase QueD [Acidobacteriota bacterium]PIE91313.1 MAG: 6-carboxytetrahydropterin synthase QueD [Acidobacteriota bacterium]
MFELKIKKDFAGAHNLRDYNGKCENLHGHNWVVYLYVQGEQQQKNGILVDFKTIKKCLNQILEELDHAYLNELPAFKELNPSAENLAKHIFREAQSRMDWTENPTARVSRVTVFETAYSSATYWE